MVRKQQNMPPRPVRNSFRLPQKSIVHAQRTAKHQELMVRLPLIISCVVELVMPKDSRRSFR